MVSAEPVFYLIARSFSENSAGIRAIHMLCHELKNLGFDAFLVGVDKPLVTSQGLNTPLLTKKIRNDHFKSGVKVISVQDESVIGLPLKGNVSVIWSLNHVGYLAGDKKSKEIRRPLLNFVYAKELNSSATRLFVNTVNYEFFKNFEPGLVRDTKLFYAGKLKSLGIQVKKPEGAIEIFRSGPLKQTRLELRSLFSRSSVLYLAEDSAMALEAAICGCPTVHMIEYFHQEPLFQEDGGFGLSKSDDPAALLATNLNSDRTERYMATLELRSCFDVINFALISKSLLENSRVQGRPRFKISVWSRFLLRFYKLKAAYSISGFAGVMGVFFSHRSFRHRGS
jgi:hypothetical protein